MTVHANGSPKAFLSGHCSDEREVIGRVACDSRPVLYQARRLAPVLVAVGDAPDALQVRLDKIVHDRVVRHVVLLERARNLSRPAVDDVALARVARGPHHDVVVAAVQVRVRRAAVEDGVGGVPSLRVHRRDLAARREEEVGLCEPRVQGAGVCVGRQHNLGSLHGTPVCYNAPPRVAVRTSGDLLQRQRRGVGLQVQTLFQGDFENMAYSEVWVLRGGLESDCAQNFRPAPVLARLLALVDCTLVVGHVVGPPRLELLLILDLLNSCVKGFLGPVDGARFNLAEGAVGAILLYELRDIVDAVLLHLGHFDGLVLAVLVHPGLDVAVRRRSTMAAVPTRRR
ncbi:hypothetical protein ACKVWC_011600 [Pyricularia oryzae]